MDQYELQKEEVNVYSGCGEPRFDCFVYCLDGSAWLTTAE